MNRRRLRRPGSWISPITSMTEGMLMRHVAQVLQVVGFAAVTAGAAVMFGAGIALIVGGVCGVVVGVVLEAT